MIIKNNMTYDLSYILLYIAAFGLSDLFVERYIHKDYKKITYYSILFIIGFCSIYACQCLG